MFRNYVLIALRNLRKEKSSSIINISGLAIGIACSLLLGYYVQFERSYEQFHVNAENLFRVTLNQFNNGEFVVNDAETYQALGPDLKRTFPEVIDYVRMSHWGEDHLRTTTESFYEDLIYLSDPSVFDLFTIKFVHGDPTVNFSEPNKAVISDRLAQRIFGDTEVIGETILLGYYETPLMVTGVFEALPANTHLKFEMLISHETLPRLWDWYAEYPWSGNNEYTYLLMNPGTSVEAFNQKLNQYSKVNENIENEIVISERIGDIHLYSNKSFEPEVNGDVRIVNFMMMLGIFILLLAWVNYVNLSTAKAINRSKEVGIRKVICSSQLTLIIQFLI